jgi:putative MATE family efflux protein
MRSRFQSILDFYRDGEYFHLMVKFALPIALQSLVMSSLNMVAVMMIGQLGETSVAAVGLANQVWFLLSLVVFGVVSGAAMFVAQLWGKRDIPNIRRVVGLTVKLGLVAALVFWALAMFFPQAVLRLYTEDAAVIALGGQYLRLFSWSYAFFAVTSAYAFALRSTGNVRLPLVISTGALVFNILLAYALIFGVRTLGLPALGINGAALAGLAARVLEFAAMLFFVYRDRSSPVAASLRDLVELDFKFMGSVLRPVLPVIINEFLWSMGVTTYSAIYAHIGTGAIAAINIVATIDQLAFVVFIGVGNATAILVGNLIGQGDKEKAFRYAGRSLSLQIVGGALMGVLVYAFAGGIFRVYKVSPEVIADSIRILTVLALGMWVRAGNHVIVIGILRSGGDTRFSLVLDGLIIWIVGVPFTAAGAFLLHLPVQLVYALTLSEETTKFFVGLWRYFSRKWMHDLTQLPAESS